MIAVLHETRSCNKGFELTHFYVWFRPALSYLWDIEHFLQWEKLAVHVIDHTIIFFIMFTNVSNHTIIFIFIFINIA